MKRFLLFQLMALLVLVFVVTTSSDAQKKHTKKQMSESTMMQSGQSDTSMGGMHMGGMKGSKGMKKEMVDINSASKEELMELPGVGDAYAQKIIDNRPYKTKADLTKKKIVPSSVYSKIKGHIVAKKTDMKKSDEMK